MDTHVYEYYQWKMNTIRIISQSLEYVQSHCNDRRNLLHFACRKWYLYNNPQC